MLKKFTSLLIGSMILISSFAIIAQAGTLYNLAYRNVPTLTGTTEFSTNTQLWRIVNGYKGTTSGHDFFQTKALATVDTQFELFFDLGVAYPVEKIVMRGGNNAYPVDFSFTTSETNNNDWTAFGSKTGHTAGYSETTLTHTAINARYVKMIVTKSNSTTPAISEIEVFSQTAPLSNIAIGSTAVFEGTTTNSTNVPANGVNGISALTASNDFNTNLNLNQAQTTAVGATTAWKYKVTLQQFYSISKIVLVPGKTAYPTKYTIETSLDDRNWSPIVTQATGTGGFVPVTYHFSTIDAKFIRLNVTENNAANSAISELEVFGVISLIQNTPIYTKDMQLRKSVSSSIPTVEERKTSYINDGISGTVTPALNNYTQLAVVNTTWADDAAGVKPDLSLYQYVPWNIILDLGRELNVTTIKVAPGKSQYVKQFKLYVSTDGDVWTEKVYEINGTNNYIMMTYNFDVVSARYVRFEALENSHWKPCVSEIIIENQSNISKPVAQDMSATAYSYFTSRGEITASDVDGDELEYFILSQPQHGKVTLNGKAWAYISKESTDCEDSFVVGVDDGYGVYTTSTVSLDVHKTLDFTTGYGFKDVATNTSLTEIEEGEIECSIPVKNFYTEAMPCVFVVAVYQSGVLKDITFSTDTSIQPSETVLYKANVNVEGGVGYSIKTFLWNDTTNYMPIVNIGGLGLTAGTNEISANDATIKYFGRWDKSDNQVYKSNWGGAYLKVGFTGTTVKLKLASTATLFVNIDETEDVLYTSVNGIVDLTPTPLSAGTHSLRISAKSEGNGIPFQGLLLDENAQTVQTPVHDKMIEFIGDSITAGLKTTKGPLSDYAWLTGEALASEHTQIALSSITLVDGYKYVGSQMKGMNVQYLKLQPTNYVDSPDWDFSAYSPDIVVINLGTNDVWVNPATPNDVFQAEYINFLISIRNKFPNAEIFAMRTFAGYKAAQTSQAVIDRNNAGDTKVHYIDTTGWIISSEDTVDNAHPSDRGHEKIADRLIPILQPYLQ